MGLWLLTHLVFEGREERHARVGDRVRVGVGREEGHVMVVNTPCFRRKKGASCPPVKCPGEARTPVKRGCSRGLEG